MNRSKEIDFLRGIAVLLVVFFHFPVIAGIDRMGWIGVDLFFVLSGFLVSGLLFKEYLRHGKVDAKRFLIRRGFKIYPLFYLFMAATFIVRLCFHESFTVKETVGELLFVRNYTGGYWAHTWSLSVEEHFYFLLVFGVLFMVKKNLMQRPKLITTSFISIMVLCLCVRIINSIVESRIGSNTFFNPWARYVHTHFRIDSLLFGVLLSYHYHLNKERFIRFVSGKRKILLPLCVCCVLPAALLDKEGIFISTIGYSLLYLGFGALLLYFITDDAMQKKLEKIFSSQVVKMISYVGIYSYSIYIWHVFVREYFIKQMDGIWGLNKNVEFVIYVAVSLIFGIFLSKYVEFYFIKIRDKFFPSASV